MSQHGRILKLSQHSVKLWAKVQWHFLEITRADGKVFVPYYSLLIKELSRHLLLV